MGKIRFEISRIFGKKVNILFLIIFLILAVYFIFTGTGKYRDFLEERDFFVTYEKNKVRQYVMYTQYGGYGFRVLYATSPLNVFFNNSGVFENLVSNVDMREIIHFNRSYKGKDLFHHMGFFDDFSSLTFLFGSLLMLFFGITSFQSEKHFFSFSSPLIRMAILDFVFLVLVVLLFSAVQLAGVPLQALEVSLFFKYTLYMIVFLSFFFASGLFLRAWASRLERAYVFAFLFWFLAVLVIPSMTSLAFQEKAQSLPANEKYNIVKLEEVMAFEREMQRELLGVKDLEEKRKLERLRVREFIDTGYKENTRREEELHEKVLKLARLWEREAKFFPPTFYLYIAGELSGKGYSGYFNFFKYIMNLRKEFVKFYIRKKFYSDDRRVESFVKGDENIFQSKSRLPGNFYKGLGFCLVYTLALLVGAFFILRGRGNANRAAAPPFKDEFETGKFYFILCENERARDELFTHFLGREDAVCVDKVNAEEIDPGIGLLGMVKYFSRHRGVSEKEVLHKLALLGLGNPAKEKKTEENIRKIYCAVCFSVEARIIVVREFIRNASREFEKQFLQLIAEANLAGKTVLYISDEIFFAAMPMDGDFKIDRYKEFKLDDPLAVTLR